MPNIVADPGSGTFLTPGSGIGKKISPKDHISVSLETIFWVKIIEFFDADPGSGIFLTPGSGIFLPLDPGSGFLIRDKHPGSATLAPNVSGERI